jgi:hypothetical protein
MNFIDFEVGGKTYKLRLNTKNTIMLEKQIGCNPLSIFGNGEEVPTITAMVAVLHASLQQYNHGISLMDAYDIFDAYISEGHSSTDFIPTMIEIYKASGIIPKESAAEDITEKNG